MKYFVLNEMAQQIHKANAQKGFWEVPAWARMAGGAGVVDGYLTLKKSEKIALIHSELSECLEGVRKFGPDQHCPDFTSEEIEMADAIIRIFDYAGGFNLRLAQAVEAKLAFNETRPHKHGKAF